MGQTAIIHYEFTILRTNFSGWVTNGTLTPRGCASFAENLNIADRIRSSATSNGVF